MFDGILKLFNKQQTQTESGFREKLSHLEEILGVEIENQEIFARALRHRSSVGEGSPHAETESYERLEFLGDAVLDLIVSEIIFQRYPSENEGFMTKLRAQIVKGDSLAQYAKALKLGDIMEVAERRKDQKLNYSKSILADVFEALIGALYLTKGHDPTYAFVKQVVREEIDFDEIIHSLDNHKSILLEYTQAQQWSIPEYRVLNEYGPGHDKTFEVEVIIGDTSMGEGMGKSKKEAEQKAARDALEKLNATDFRSNS